jgi:hypothetical protein
MSPLLVAALALAALPGDWQFHDETAHAGRSLLAFRRVELRDRPVVPVTIPDIRAGARFGQPTRRQRLKGTLGEVIMGTMG